MSEQGSSQKNAALSDRESETDLVRETNKPLVNYVERLGLFQKLKFKASNRLQDFSGILGHDFRYETDRGLAFNLVPVFLAAGIMIYFHVPAEPLIFVVLLSAIVVMAIAASIKFHGAFYYGLAATATILLGMMAAQFSVLSSDTVQIERQVTTEVTGLVLGVDSNRRGSPRLLIKPNRIR